MGPTPVRARAAVTRAVVDVKGRDGRSRRAREARAARWTGASTTRRARGDPSVVAVGRSSWFTIATTGSAVREVTPGKGPGSPKWVDIHRYLTESGRVRSATPAEIATLLANGRGVVVDVRQPLEHEEWRIPGMQSAPYLVPMENLLRRASGYFLSIKGGLKERNASFVENVDALTASRRQTTVALIDLRGGDLTLAPNTGSTSVSDRGDSTSLRAAYELVQAGYTDVRYVPGGFSALIDEGGLPYESEKYGKLLEFVGDGTRKTLMYSNLLPDPSLAPGVLVQLVLLVILALFQ